MYDLKEPPERITGFWNYHARFIQKDPSMPFRACAYIRQDIAKELALALVDLCEDAAIEDMMLCSGKTRKRCREIKETAITYMED
jgi:hypothetical protein